jgi:UDP-N-acetylmuramoylalanine--D-glutamate ligase
MRIAIVGYGLEGKSSYKYYSSKSEHQITICDQNKDLSLPENVGSQLGPDYLNNLDSFDLIVRSAGLPPKLILDVNPNVDDKITTQLNEFLRVCPTKNVIGVTGTKGKGTTSSLIALMLQKSNHQVLIGGNIGIAMLDMLDQINKQTFVVLELSSFQLVDLKETAPSLAVCLMVVPEHLNWHQDLNEYIGAKTNLFNHQAEDSVAVYFESSAFSRQITATSPGHKIPYFVEPGAFVLNGQIIIDGKIICHTEDLKIIGEHNWQNACAAITVFWEIEENQKAAAAALTEFAGLEHRLEFVSEVNGVGYYDDSFGTTPETAEVAIKAFSKPEILIAGGSDKGIVYDLLVDSIIKSNIKFVICIGTTGKKIAELIESRKNEKEVEFELLPLAATMDEIVNLAQAKAEAGDVVLLSTGSASFDMFKNYKDRGDKFKASVAVLAKDV